ncbi:PFL_4703 family integrating conjugative element protein [Hahella ganghwensis]|uniref:PFL_4703 family integrating conjugative element protein n=1 Tax=Hahella ganghwensis TaxID=286420 RepID=UPI00037AB9FE|nr:TIGR03746 family integrating conjugative element protein [Hahella ganghwensis]
MGDYKSKTDNLARDIRYRDRIIVGLFILLTICLWGWKDAPKDIDLHYPPDLRSGAISKIGEIPPENIYSFSHYIFQHLQNWETNGAQDYMDNRKKFRAFLTPQYQQFITDDAESRKADLLYRRRELHPIPGSSFESKSVKVLGPNSWVVFLDFQVKEYIKGSPVKDVYIRYPMKVVRYEVAREANPWQLALAGYVTPPIQLSKKGGG